MKKKETKKTKIEPRKKTEVARGHFGVILERMEHKFDLLSEGFLGLDKSVKRLDKKFDNLSKKVDDNHKETNGNFRTLFKFRNETNDNFRVSFEYLSKIDDEIQSIKKEMIKIKDSIINGERINPVKFLQIEKRVEAVEKELACYHKR